MMQLKVKDIKIGYFKSSGPGGQHKNKRFTAVRVVHLPTQISATCSEERSQAVNKKIALFRLSEKLRLLSKKRKPRIPVSIPQNIRQNILEAKKKNSQKKKLRQKIKFEKDDI